MKFLDWLKNLPIKFSIHSFKNTKEIEIENKKAFEKIIINKYDILKQKHQ